jgi:hypothetical protein
LWELVSHLRMRISQSPRRNPNMKNEIYSLWSLRSTYKEKNGHCNSTPKINVARG